MNNFIFENATKVYFGKGCVKEYLACLSGRYGQTVMLCYGGGSVKKNGIYDEVTALPCEKPVNPSWNSPASGQIPPMPRCWRERGWQRKIR